MNRRFHVLILVAVVAVAPLAAQTGDDESDRQALVLVAIQGLMSAPPDRAIPLIEKVLAGDYAREIKQRALFVASQLDDPRARSIVVEQARSGGGPLRADAIRMLGVSGDEAALQELEDLYAAGNAETRERVLEAWLIAGDPSPVFRVALEAERDREFDGAVRVLAAMGARDELRQLGERLSSESLLQAFAMQGDLESLRDAALAEPEPGGKDLRREAIRGIAVIGGDRAHEALMTIYRSADDPAVKEVTARALLMSGHDEGLLTLYRESGDAAEKRELLRMLVQMDSEAALEAIDSALEGGQR